MTDPNLYCRLCFSVCQDSKCYIPLSCNKENGARQTEILKRLESLIPSLDLTLTPSPGICSHCEDTLSFASNLILLSIRNQNTLLNYKSQHEGSFINIHDIVVESNNSTVISCNHAFEEINHLITNNKDLVEENNSTNKRRKRPSISDNKKQKLSCTYNDKNFKEVKNQDGADTCKLSLPLPEQQNLYVIDSVTISHTSKNPKETAIGLSNNITQESGHSYSKISDGMTNLSSNSYKNDIQELAGNSLNCPASSQVLADKLTETKQVQICQSNISRNLDTPLFPPLRRGTGENIFLKPNLKTYSNSRNRQGKVNHSSSKNVQGNDGQIDKLPNTVSNPETPLSPPELGNIYEQPYQIQYQSNKGSTNISTDRNTHGQTDKQLNSTRNLYTPLSPPSPEQGNIYFMINANNVPNEIAQDTDGQIDNGFYNAKNLDTPLSPPLKEQGNLYVKSNSKMCNISKNIDKVNTCNKNIKDTVQTNDEQLNSIRNSITPLPAQGNNYVQSYFNILCHASTNPTNATNSSNKDTQVTVGNELNSSASTQATQFTEIKQGQIDNQPIRGKSLVSPLPLLQQENLYLKPNAKIYQNISRSHKKKSKKSSNRKVQGTDKQVDNQPNSIKNPDTPLSPPVSEQGNLYVKLNSKICNTSKSLDKKRNNYSNENIQETVQTDEQLNSIRNSVTPLPEQENYYVQPDIYTSTNPTNAANSSNKDIQVTVGNESNSPASTQATQFTEIKQGQIDNQPIKGKSLVSPLPLLQQENLYLKPNAKIYQSISRSHKKKSKNPFNRKVQGTDKQVVNKPDSLKKPDTLFSLPLPEQGKLFVEPHIRICDISRKLNKKATNSSHKNAQGSPDTPLSPLLPEQGNLHTQPLLIICHNSTNPREKSNNSNKDKQATVGNKLYCQGSTEVLATEFTETTHLQNDCQSSKGRTLVVTPLSPPLLQQENLYIKSNTNTSRKRNANKTAQGYRQIDCNPNSIQTLNTPPQGNVDYDNNPQQPSCSSTNPENENLIENNKTKERPGSLEHLNILIKTEPIDDESDISLAPVHKQGNIFVTCDIPAISKQEKANYTVKEDTKENVKLEDVSSTESSYSFKSKQGYGPPNIKSRRTSLLLPLKKQGNKFVNSHSQISSWKKTNKGIRSANNRPKCYSNVDTPLSPPLPEQGNVYVHPYSKICNFLTHPKDTTGTVRGKLNYSSSTPLLTYQFTQTEQGCFSYQPNRSPIVDTPLSPPLLEQGTRDNQPESIQQSDTPQSPPLMDVLVDSITQEVDSSNVGNQEMLRNRIASALAQLLVDYIAKITEQSNSRTSPGRPLSLLKQDNVLISPPHGSSQGSPVSDNDSANENP